MAFGLWAVTVAMRAVMTEVSVNQIVGVMAMAGVVGRGDGRWAGRQACAKLYNIQ